jgi:protein associated with RNAse G/E
MTASRTVTINSRKADGSVRRTWQCQLIEEGDDELVFVGTFDADVVHSDLGLIRKGTVSYEYYWTDRWYNIFAFFEPDGSFRNYYCNVSMPPTFEGEVLDYLDLEIDVVVWPNWSYKVLDEDEYERNADTFGYSDAIRNRVLETVAELRNMIDSRVLPAHH